MVWSNSYPPDIPAKTLDQALRNTKVLISERSRMNNGSYEEHSFFGFGATGLHPLSQVGFVQIHPSYSDLTSTVCPFGSLHYVKADPDPTKVGLWIKDQVAFTLMVGLDHRELINLSGDVHTQYYLRDSTRPMGKEVRTDTPPVEDTPGTNSDNPIGSSHASLSWQAAHGVDGELLINRHFADGLFSSVISSSVSGSWTNDPNNPTLSVPAGTSGVTMYLSIPKLFIIYNNGQIAIGGVGPGFNSVFMKPGVVGSQYQFTLFGTGSSPFAGAVGIGGLSGRSS